MNNERLISFLLRAGIAIAFLYAAIAAFLDPFSWIGFMPSWIDVVVPRSILLSLFSAYEIVLSFWLLSGKHIVRGVLVAAATLFFIIIFNITLLDIVFRDIPILFAALALMALEKKHDI